MRRLFTKQNKALLSELVRTDFKLRYQGSLLGYMWSLLKPLFLFVILYIVFVYFLKTGEGIPHFPVYLLLGIVLWNFFTEMTSQSLGSIVDRGDLIRKIRIPRWMIVASTSLSALINLGLSLLIVLIFIIANKVPFTFDMLWIFVYILAIYLFALGLSLILSAAYVKFRDLRHIWEIILQAGFYATPIIYPIQMIENISIERLLLLNPIAQAIQGARHHVVTDVALTTYDAWEGGWQTIIPIVTIGVVLVIGVLYFKKQSRFFAENI